MSTQSKLFNVTGEVPVDPKLYVQPTVQRASPAANVGWTFRRRCTITNTGAEPISNYPYAIDLGDTTGLTTTKAQADGDDVRVVHNGREVPRTLVNWDSASPTTLAWIVIDYLGAGQSLDWDAWYGNTAAVSGGVPALTLMDDLPAFDIQTAGASRSHNGLWVYNVDRVAGNAGKGGWALSTGTAQPDVAFGVPGAWQPDNTRQSDDDRWQEAYSTYVATGTKYQGRFEARRARPGALTVGPNSGNDGVVLRNPVGIESVECDIRWINMAIGESDDTPIGKVVIATRNNPDEEWKVLFENAALQATEATIASATYTPAAKVKELAFAVWPQDGDNVDPAARPDRFVNAAWDTTLEVAIDDSVVTQSLAAEEAIYELATELRHGGGGDAVAVPPYKSIYLGNAASASGEGTPRLAVELNEQVVVKTAERKVEVWNSALTAKVEDTPIPAVRAVDGVRDGNGATVEQISNEWMPLLPVVNPLTNPSADTVATGWTTGEVTTGITLSSRTRVTSPHDSAPAAFLLQISANTSGVGGTVEQIADDFLPVGTRQNVSLGVAVRTADVDIQPTPTVWFYDAAQALLGSRVMQADWTIPAINTWYRRLFAAAVPTGAIYYRVGVVAKSKTSNQTGNFWWDSVEVNDTEVALLDVSKGTLALSARWKNRHAYS